MPTIRSNPNLLIKSLTHLEQKLPNLCKRYRTFLYFTPILLIAFLLRVWDINARSLWFDEAVEYWAASAPLWALPKTVLIALQPPLYTYFLHFWLVVGKSAIWLRFLSLTLSMLTLIGIARWANKLFGLRGALLAAAITAILPTEIRYAQEIGEYALMECVLVWSLCFLEYSLSDPRWTYWGLWGFASILSVLSHYGTILVVPPLAILTLVTNLWQRRIRPLIQQSIILIIVTFITLPLLVHFLPNQLQRTFSGPAFASSPPFSELEQFVNSFVFTFAFPLTGWPYSNLAKWLPSMAIGIVLGLALLILLTPSVSIKKRTLWWFLFTFIIYYLAVRSGVYSYAYSGFRYALILAPLFILAIVAVVEQLHHWRKKILATVLILFIAGLALYSIPNRSISQLTRGEMDWPETHDLREVTLYWIEHRTNLEPTYVYYGAVPAFRYYLRYYGLDTEPLPPSWLTDCWNQSTVEACTRDNIYYGEWFRSQSSERMFSSIEMTLGGIPHRLWLIFSHLYPGEDELILGELLEKYKIADCYKQVNASVYLLEMDQ